MPRTPNPMYLFSNAEINLLTEIYMDRALSYNGTNMVLGGVRFTCNGEGEARILTEKLSQLKELSTGGRIIFKAIFPTTLKHPHHIHEDARKEDLPGRKGAMRTYFDGSYVMNVAHAVMVCIDDSEKCITTQCPHGYDFPEAGEEVLYEVYPEYELVTLHHKQQQDSHSCVPLTLHNMFAMAGLHETQENIDIQAWRSELLDVLEQHDAELSENLEKLPKYMSYKFYGHPTPIFDQRYI